MKVKERALFHNVLTFLRSLWVINYHKKLFKASYFRLCVRLAAGWRQPSRTRPPFQINSQARPLLKTDFLFSIKEGLEAKTQCSR